MEEYLKNLPTETLIKIFQHLTLADLLNLRLTCRRFYTIVTTWMHLLVENDFLVTNQLSAAMKERSKLQPSAMEKIRISVNWKKARYKQIDFIKWRTNFTPQLSLTNDLIWISNKYRIDCFKRRVDANIFSSSINLERDANVLSFVYKQNTLVSGLDDGSVWIWSPNIQKLFMRFQNCHKMEVTSVDISGRLIATGSGTGSCKLWHFTPNRPSNQFINFFETNLRMSKIMCSKFSADGRHLLVGTGGRSGFLSRLHRGYITLVDVERKRNHACFFDNFSKRDTIWDVIWESPNIFWSCGSNALLRRWDLRTGICEQMWKDPHSAPLLCFDYDNCYSAITGTEKCGRTVLWDTRQREDVQRYYIHENMSIHSVKFDVTQLCIATKKGLIVLDFYDSTARERGKNNV